MHDSAAIAAAERIRAQAGARVHRLGSPEELTEEAAMPRGVYNREKKLDTVTAKPPAEPAKKRGRKPGSKAAAVPRFGVFDDGSISIILPKFSGNLSAEEARQFVAFLGKIGVKV